MSTVPTNIKALFPIIRYDITNKRCFHNHYHISSPDRVHGGAEVDHLGGQFVLIISLPAHHFRQVCKQGKYNYIICVMI